VDDEFSVRHMAEQVLRTHDYRVIAADSGATALAAYHNSAGKIAILITDLLMPGMDGAELIRQLRSRNPALKVIAISGQLDRSENGASPMDIMADAFLHKPFTVEELLSQTAATLQEIR
jgi:two-component system, cell cycle sensor histidine kinase and response regulator CckA